MRTKIVKFSEIFVLFSVIMLMSGCGTSLRLATQHSMDNMSDSAYRAKAAETGAGYQEANGLPGLAERFAKRPNLKIAVLQYATTIQGDISRDFADTTYFSMLARTYGGHFQTKELKQLDAIEVPGDVGLHLATDGLKKLEAQLKEAGFVVIDSDKVINTKAYKKYYGVYPSVAVVEKGDYDITSLAAGWTTFAPKGYRVKAPSGVIQIAQAHWVWPDAEALKEIATEMGEDVLFVNVSTVFSNHEIGGKGQTRSRHGIFNSNAKAAVVDPEFVGAGIGGFGHMVVGVDAGMNPPVSRQGFLKEIETAGHGEFVVDWNMLVRDSEYANDYYAQAFANALKELRQSKEN